MFSHDFDLNLRHIYPLSTYPSQMTFNIIIFNINFKCITPKRILTLYPWIFLTHRSYSFFLWFTQYSPSNQEKALYAIHLKHIPNSIPCHHSTAAAAASLQSCPTLCNSPDGSSPGSPIPGILQARMLEWVAISFSSAWKWKVKVKSLSSVRLLATPWNAAYQAPPFMGFSRQEYWSEVPLPSSTSLLLSHYSNPLSSNDGSATDTSSSSTSNTVLDPIQCSPHKTEWPF